MTATLAWACLCCDESGEGASADREAERHTKASGHGTTTFTRTERPLAPGMRSLAECIDEVRVQLEQKRKGRTK